MAAESVLVIDDTPVNLKLADLILRKEGFEVRTARNAEEALALLQGFRPDLILVDINLPGMDGLELTRCIKSDPGTADITVVALTASMQPELKEQAFAAGCTGYILKPMDTKTLGETVRGHLYSRRASRRLPSGIPFKAVELEALRRRFLEEGLGDTRRMLETLSGAFDYEKAGRLLHQWAGAGGALGYSEVTDTARAAEQLLQNAPLDKAALRETLTNLLYAFSDSAQDDLRPLPEFILRELDGKRVALTGFAPEDAERLCAALERAGARPRLFRAMDAPDSGPVRDCALAMIHVDAETARSPWLSPARAFPDQPIVLVGGRDRLMALDARVQLLARELLIDGWQPEEALMRCTLALQRAAVPAPAVSDSPVSAGSRASAPAASGPPRVVIADDDAVIRTLLRGTLENYGMTCLVATNGPDALNLIRTERPDAAVLDINMPEMDGYLVLAAIRHEKIPVPVLLLTARSHENDISRGFTLGADDYVVKPFNSIELVARVKRLLRR